jgi:hypothetical protein
MAQPFQPARYGFNSGSLWTIPGVASPTPQKFGTLQDGTIDLSFTSKELFGQMMAPQAVGVSQLKITGSAKYARLRGSVLRDLVFPGMTTATQGQAVIVEGETVTITSETGSVANKATFIEDLGAYYPDGTPLQRVTTLSAVGQYTVSGGTYTLYTGDTATSIVVDYQYTATTGSILTVNNAPAGLMPSFQCVLQVNYGGVPTSIQLFAAMSTKFNFQTKLGDFTIPQFDFSAYADPMGRILAFGGEL